MNCMNCGRHLQDAGQDYCPHCGANVLLQRKVDYLSKYYYNKGLEKAQIRDLSGAISYLKQSLMLNKENIQARNLLGLAYFETGEVVAALSEWVISKNLSPRKNLADDYIKRLQANQGRLDAINETIRKYNEALILAGQHQEDMAAVKLRKVLVQNPKLIKGYHLLALIQMKNQEYGKARRTLKKAAKIDKTNTTTLRFLAEIDEKIGVEKKKSRVRRGFFVNKRSVPDAEDALFESESLGTAQVSEPGRGSLFLMLALGLVVGAAAFWMLAVPGIRQRIYREANRQIVRYSESVSSQGAELSRLVSEARENGTTADAVAGRLVVEKHRSDSYRALFEAYLSMVQEDYDSAALEVQQVYEDTLTDNMRAIYNMVVSATGVGGITTSSSEVGDEERQEYLSTGYEATEESYQEEGEDEVAEGYDSYEEEADYDSYDEEEEY